jgi:hypothetical protein
MSQFPSKLRAEHRCVVSELRVELTMHQSLPYDRLNGSKIGDWMRASRFHEFEPAANSGFFAHFPGRHARVGPAADELARHRESAGLDMGAAEGAIAVHSGRP